MRQTEEIQRNKDVILVLENVMDVCLQLVIAKRDSKSEKCGFAVGSTKQKYVLEKGAAGALFRCVYGGYHAGEDCAEKGDNALIHIEGLLYKENKWNICPIVLQNDMRDVQVEGAKESDTEELELIRDSLDKTFLPKEKRLKFQDSLDGFIKVRKQIDFNHTIFPEESAIRDYLQAYYELLGLILVNKDYINSERKIGELLDTLLYLDTSWTFREGGKATFGSIYHPIALNALLKTYRLVEAYWSQLEESANTVMDIFYKEVVTKKAQYAFRWFMAGSDHDLLHAAVSPYVERGTSDKKIGVWIKNIDQYNSFEGIGEMRLAEKTLYEFRKWKNRAKAGEVFHAAVLGDVSRTPMEQLAEYLGHSIQKLYLQRADEKIQVEFDVYTKNVLDCSDTINKSVALADSRQPIEIRARFFNRLDELLMDRSEVDSLIEKHELIFMLDCCKLYLTTETQTRLSDAALRQKFAAKCFDEVSLTDKTDICRKNLLDKLYENWSVYKKNGYWGCFQKTANDLLLRYCEDKIKGLKSEQTGESKYCSLYVYVSDRNAFNSIFCNDKYYMRTERYNQKRIGIIRFTSVNTENTRLPVSSGREKECRVQNDGAPIQEEKMLCFNLWQIVKHINLDKREEIISLIADEINGKTAEEDMAVVVHDYDLQSMYVGIEYSAWPNRLELYYAIDESNGTEKTEKDYFERFIDCFVKKVALPILKSSRDNLFGQYFWRALCSLLYSDAKNMQDMLLLHLLTDKSDMVGEFCIGENMQIGKSVITRNINRDYKYSIKRFVEMIMREYDTTATASYSQMQTEYMIRQNRDIEGGMVELFQGVKAACEQLSYKNSYLYENCKKILQGEML